MAEAELDLGFLLRDITAGPITTTTSSTPVGCRPDLFTSLGWMIYVNALNAVSTETYVFALETSDLTGGSYVNLATWVWPRARGTGKAIIGLVGDQAFWTNTVTRFLRVTATLGGSSPSIVYGSGMVKLPTRLGTASRPGNILMIA